MVILGAIYGSAPNPDEEKISKTFFTIFLFALVPSAITFYEFYFFIFPRILKKKNYYTTALIGVLIAITSGIIGFTLLYFIYGGTCTQETDSSFLEDFIGISLFIAFIALISGIIALVIQGFITWFDEIKLKEELKQKTFDTELALVKSQLDPHFLFNTINNIDVLILKDPKTASDYLNHLSDIMRFMLFETKADEIPLTKELEYIDKYIELQRIRTSNTTYVEYTVTGVPDEKKIAPMIFIPFIENAFKHTTNKKIEEAINIKIEINDHSVKMICINKIDPNRSSNAERNGLGNQLIEKRLNLIYPKRHSLEVTNEDYVYSVCLKITYA